MKTDKDKLNTESSNENAPDNRNGQTPVTMQNDNKNDKIEIIVDKLKLAENTVINIENNDRDGARLKGSALRKYCVMFFGSNIGRENQIRGPPMVLNQGGGPPLQNSPQEVPLPLQAYKPETRNPFVKLVLIIVFIMMLATAALVGTVWILPDVKRFFQDSGWTILLPALVLLLIVDYGMICSPCSRQLPGSAIFLVLAVIAMSLICAKITTHFKTEVVLYAIIATTAVVLVCALLACSKFDFTRWLLYVVVIATALSMVFLIVILVRVITGNMMKPLVLTMLVASTILHSILLTIQLQTILGGRTVEMSESDYALAAFMLYTSVIDIFLKMVQIIGISGRM